jgi:ActR/RegA family two-component response regulator
MRSERESFRRKLVVRDGTGWLRLGRGGVATGQAGALAYLTKPFSLDELSATIERVRQAPPDLDTLLRASVGQIPMRELQQRVRNVRVGQALALALALAQGSRSGAARLLDVSRQALQQITRKRRQRKQDGANKEAPMHNPAIRSGVGLIGGGPEPGIAVSI